LTFDEFEQLPDEPGKCELLDGELIQSPSAPIAHKDIRHLLYETLRAVVPRRKAYMATGHKLGPQTWLQPDVSIPGLKIDLESIFG
jgi:Uma2 family endonuclease